MTTHTTPPLAQQLRSLAASAPTLHRPALAAAADAVEECARLRHDIERHVAIAADLATEVESLRTELTNEREVAADAETDYGQEMDALRAERDEARELLQRARECEGLDFWTDDDASSLREDIDAALKDAK